MRTAARGAGAENRLGLLYGGAVQQVVIDPRTGAPSDVLELGHQRRPARRILVGGYDRAVAADQRVHSADGERVERGHGLTAEQAENGLGCAAAGSAVTGEAHQEGQQGRAGKGRKVDSRRPGRDGAQALAEDGRVRQRRDEGRSDPARVARRRAGADVGPLQDGDLQACCWRNQAVHRPSMPAPMTATCWGRRLSDTTSRAGTRCRAGPRGPAGTGAARSGRRCR